MDLIYEDRESLEQVQERYVQGYPHFKNTLHISAVYEEGLTQVKVQQMTDFHDKILNFLIGYSF
jgi:hypothetical protein